MSCAPSDLCRTVGLIAIALLASCGSVSMDLPAPFLQLRTHGDQLKATTPDDARLWVRHFDDLDGGDTAFWADALRHDLERRGYRPDGGIEEVRDAAGRVGGIQEFSVELDGEEHGYLVAVFALGDRRVRVAEFVAPRTRFDELEPAIRAAVTTLSR